MRRDMARGPRSDGGFALLVVITLVLLVGGIGAAVSIATRTETLIAANFRQGREALYAAEGALAVAIRDLSGIAEWDVVLSGAVVSTFTHGGAIGARRTPGGELVTLCCGPPSLTDEVQMRAFGGRSWGENTPLWQIFAWGPTSAWLDPGRIDSDHYVAVWVADDPEDGDGNPAADVNRILELHAQALGPSGGRRIVQATVQRQTVGDEAIPGPAVAVLSWREIKW